MIKSSPKLRYLNLVPPNPLARPIRAWRRNIPPIGAGPAPSAQWRGLHGVWILREDKVDEEINLMSALSGCFTLNFHSLDVKST